MLFEMRTELSHPLVPSPNVQNSRLDKAGDGRGDSIQVSHMGGRNPRISAITASSPSVHEQEAAIRTGPRPSTMG